MYYNTIILIFFNNELINKENSYYFKEEIAYIKSHKNDINFYWRIRITTNKTHETRGTYMQFGLLKNYLNGIFPILKTHLKFDDPNVNDDTVVYIKFSGRGKNLTHNLSELKHFINTNDCTEFDIKYGIFLSDFIPYEKKINKFSRKSDIATHNENGCVMYGYLKEKEWVCYKNASSVLIIKDNDKKSTIMTAFYLEYVSNIPTISFIENEFIPLVRKFKLAQILSE